MNQLVPPQTYAIGLATVARLVRLQTLYFDMTQSWGNDHEWLKCHIQDVVHTEQRKEKKKPNANQVYTVCLNTKLKS